MNIAFCRRLWVILLVSGCNADGIVRFNRVQEFQPTAERCQAASDCTRAPTCQTTQGATCVGGTCQYPAAPEGASCTSSNRCVTNAACDANGECVGSNEITCAAPPPSYCNAGNDSFVQFLAPGTCDPTTGSCTYQELSQACPDCETNCLPQCGNLSCNAATSCQEPGRCVVESGVASCLYPSLPDGTACEDQNPEDCGTAACRSGVCQQNDAIASFGTTCRPATGACDQAETCDGVSSTCPANTLKGANEVCRSADPELLCDGPEVCDGTSAACPPDVPLASGTVCRPTSPGATCDFQDVCDGASFDCPDSVRAAGIICRASAGPCDEVETCDGTNPACPSNLVKSVGTVCGPSNGVCDLVDTCDGTSPACPNLVAPVGTGCREAVGLCDAPESCDGSSPVCPPDVLRTGAEVCRFAAGDCDAEERCTGNSPDCPTDLLIPPNTPCGLTAHGSCAEPTVCNGISPDCPLFLQFAGFVCRQATGPCDIQEICIGNSPICPPDQVRPAGVICNPTTGAICDADDTCDGMGKGCPPQYQAAGTVCRPSTTTPAFCDPAETCTGGNPGCPPDTGILQIPGCNGVGGGGGGGGGGK